MTAFAFPIDKARRSYLIAGLSKLEAGFARDLPAELEATKCPRCDGGGFAPYIGGEDDDTPCDRCGGSGFKPDVHGAAP